MAADDYPAPATPYTLKEMVKQIKKDSGYANFFHTLVKEARNGNHAAQDLVKKHFEPHTAELTDFQLNEGQAIALKRCTDPRTHLADFAYYVVYTVS